MRIRRFHRSLLRRLLQCLQHVRQQRAGGIRIPLHQAERNLRLRALVHVSLCGGKITLQPCNPIPGRPQPRLGPGDHPRRFRLFLRANLGKLALQRHDVGMLRSQPHLQRLQFPRNRPLLLA